jgi:hypothetical protein
MLSISARTGRRNRPWRCSQLAGRLGDRSDQFDLIAPHHPPVEPRAHVPGAHRKISPFSKIETFALAASSGGALYKAKGVSCATSGRSSATARRLRPPPTIRRSSVSHEIRRASSDRARLESRSRARLSHSAASFSATARELVEEIPVGSVSRAGTSQFARVGASPQRSFVLTARRLLKVAYVLGALPQGLGRRSGSLLKAAPRALC